MRAQRGSPLYLPYLLIDAVYRAGRIIDCTLHKYALCHGVMVTICRRQLNTTGSRAVRSVHPSVGRQEGTDDTVVDG